MTNTDKRARYRGCLLGGAVGDALGGAVEFLSRSTILGRFGPDGISEYAPAYGRLGAITDDTQMTLFTAEGLILGWARSMTGGPTSEVGATAFAYLRWLKTQSELPSPDIDLSVAGDGWLFRQRDLHHRRAPGITCLSALTQMRHAGEPARNDSKGCGGVMRMAPAGLFAASVDPTGSPEIALTLGTDLSAITHGHPTGALAGGAFAVLIMELAKGKTLPDALATAKRLLAARPHHDETLQALQAAQQLAEENTDHPRAIRKLGEGWVAEEALAISVYCALVAQDFRHGVMLGVNHDGDSDSTGSITGNLLGLALGVDAIPARWLHDLELRDVIGEVADDLCDFPGWERGEHGELTDRRFLKYSA